MRRLPIVLLAILALSWPAEAVWSKGAITKIVIEGAGLPEPLVITDPAILDRFTIWSGPGVHGRERIDANAPDGTPAFIADWTSDSSKPESTAAKRYRVRLHIAGREAPRDTYEVLYVIASDGHRGYVYLPSYPGDDFGEWNTFQILRRVEGRWFHATNEWDAVARPLLNDE